MQNHEHNPDARFCTACGYADEPVTVTPGSILIEVVLWLCLIVPGLIYSVWRIAARRDVCPACGGSSLIPIRSPVAQKTLRENQAPGGNAAASEASINNGRAQKIGHAMGRLMGRILH